MSIKGFEVGGVQERYDYTALDNTPANLVQDANYVHTDNNFTNTDKTKLDGIATGANKTIIDATLTQSGQAADAKAAGDEINDLKSAFTANLIHDTATGAIAHLEDGADDLPVQDLVVQIEPVQAGSGDPSPDNVRPISGWTGAKVTRTGKNLLKPTSRTYSDVIYSDGHYFVNISTTSSAKERALFGNWGIANAVSLGLNEGTYTWSLTRESVDGGAVADVVVRVSNHGTQAYQTWTKGSARQINADDKFFILVYLDTPNTTYKCDLGIQIELGSNATDYEPYQGETYDITFPSEAGTVYGGTLDVTNGVLTVYRAQIASYAGETLPSTWISDRDVYSAGATPTTGAQVVYELATPITYQLTPTEIRTLLGQNNIWADTGDTTVDYYADPTLYINRKIAAAVAAMS